MNRLRVCIACLDPYTFGGGTASATWAMVNALIRLGYEPTLLYVATRRKFTLSRQFHRANRYNAITVGYLPSFPYLANLLAGLVIRKDIRDFDIYQVVGGGAMAGAMFWVNRLRYAVWMGPTIVDEIGSVSWWEDMTMKNFSVAVVKILGRISILLEKSVLQAAAKVLVQSPQFVESIPRFYGISQEKVSLLDFPIDVEKFSPGTPASKPSYRYILSVGRVDDARKNFPLLIRAFKRVKREMPDLKLVIVGKISKKSKVRKLVEQLGMEEDVILTGQVKEVVDYYRGAEAFVLSSRQEGLGIVVLEAMSCGIPVISTRCGGPEGIIRHGQTGWLTSQDEGDLSDAILEVLKNRDLRASMGKAAREYILEHHTMDLFCSRLQKIYGEVYGGTAMV
jgi:glycosyltransferase involved in cell wall biosynthesis